MFSYDLSNLVISRMTFRRYTRHQGTRGVRQRELLLDFLF